MPSSEPTVYTWTERPIYMPRRTPGAHTGRPARKGDTVTADCPDCAEYDFGTPLSMDMGGNLIYPTCDECEDGTVQVKLTTDPWASKATSFGDRVIEWTAEAVITEGATDATEQED